MSKIKVNFSVTQAEAKALIASLEQVAYHSNNNARKALLLKIANEIKFDFWQDNVAFNMLVGYLDPVTSSKINKSSYLRNQLSIDPGWINGYLYKVVNLTVKRMLKLKRLNKSFTPVGSAKAAKCKKVQDVLDLIKATYDSAK